MSPVLRFKDATLFLLLCQVVAVFSQTLEEIFQDFDYSARGIDCNEGIFEDE